MHSEPNVCQSACHLGCWPSDELRSPEDAPPEACVHQRQADLSPAHPRSVLLMDGSFPKWTSIHTKVYFLIAILEFAEPTIHAPELRSEEMQVLQNY